MCGPGKAKQDELEAARPLDLEQDVYQGLGCATRADTSSILAGLSSGQQRQGFLCVCQELLGADSEEPVESEAVEAKREQMWAFH